MQSRDSWQPYFRQANLQPGAGHRRMPSNDRRGFVSCSILQALTFLDLIYGFSQGGMFDVV
jgi:hypothetical protein